MSQDVTAPPRSVDLGARSWWAAGFGVAAVGWGANQFAPLLLLYRAHIGLSALAANAAFGLYALGLIPGLLVAGRLADRIGRRRVVLPAIALSALASVLLIAGGSLGLGWLFAGRLVAGLASGGAFSAGAAWIKELSTSDDGGPGPGPRRITVAMSAGFAGGPLVAGILAQLAPAPTVAAYLPHLVLSVVALAAATRVPETRVATSSPHAGGVGPTVRSPRFLLVVLPLAPWVFGSAAIALAYLPGLVGGRLGGAALSFAAVVTALSALAGIAVQPLARRIRTPRRLLGLSLGIVVLGALVAALAAATTSPVIVVIAVLVLGAGYGACQVCGLQEVARLAPAPHLAAVTAVYQALSYLGFALPFLLAWAGALAGPPVLLLVVALAAAGTTVLTTVTRTQEPT